MIEDIGGRYGRKAVTCDGCGDGFEADDWDEARDRMKQDGWRARKVDGKYIHYCPDCAE